MATPTGYRILSYGDMITDRPRMDTYAEALRQVVKPGCSLEALIKFLLETFPEFFEGGIGLCGDVVEGIAEKGQQVYFRAVAQAVLPSGHPPPVAAPVSILAGILPGHSLGNQSIDDGRVSNNGRRSFAGIKKAR